MSNETKVNQMLQILIAMCIGFIVFTVISRYFNTRIHNKVNKRIKADQVVNINSKQDVEEEEKNMGASANYSDITPITSTIIMDQKEEEEEKDIKSSAIQKQRVMIPRTRHKGRFPNFNKERTECDIVISYWYRCNRIKNILSKDLYRMITRYYLLYVYGDDRGFYKIYNLHKIKRLYIRSRTGIASIGSTNDNIGSNIGLVRDLPLNNQQKILSISGTVCWMHNNIYLTQLTMRTNIRCYYYGGNDNFFKYKFIPYYTFLIDSKNPKKGLKRLIVYYQDIAISGIWAD